MARIKKRKPVKKSNNSAQNNAKKQKPKTFNVGRKEESDELEKKVSDYYNCRDHKDRFDIKIIKPDNEENLLDSIKNLKISDKKGCPKRSQKELKIILNRVSVSSKYSTNKSQKYTDLNFARVTRSSSVNSNVSKSCTFTSSGNQKPRGEKKPTFKTQRILRSNASKNKSVEKRKKQPKRKSSENELCEIPKKREVRAKQKERSLSPITEEINEDDNEFEDAETSTKSEKSRKSRRISERKTAAVKRKTPAKRKPKSSTKKKVPTPGMQTRTNKISKPKSNIYELRKRLHVGFVPKSLPCREAEFNNIFTFLKGKLKENMGGCIYISGVPGTGKTATVNEVIKCLKKLESQDEMPAFDFVDINGMKLTAPRQAYVQIKKKLTEITSSWEEALSYLQHRFTAPDASRKNMTLLLIDEMDLLCTNRQDVIYNILDWSTNKSHLVVIAIANTMDLPERILKGRVASRLGQTRLTFQPYSHTQLMEIIKYRLMDTESFKAKAIELVARKVASVSGDARRALDICRRATEIAENEKKEFITLLEVSSALNEMIANARVNAIKCCSFMEQTFLKAICNEVDRIGIEQVVFKNVFRQFEALCHIEGEEAPNITQVLEICRKLASWRLILWESGADLYQSIMLNVSADDIYYSKHKTP